MITVSKDWQDVRVLRAVIAGLLMFMFGVTSTFVVLRLTEKIVKIDPRMEAGCTLPRLEGEFQAATVLDGKLVCWRYK